MSQPQQQQQPPGVQAAMHPVPDCGEKTYRGSGKLEGRVAIITGADSGIGRAVAIAGARRRRCGDQLPIGGRGRA